jgi:hypothetical protein
MCVCVCVCVEITSELPNGMVPHGSIRRRYRPLVKLQNTANVGMRRGIPPTRVSGDDCTAKQQEIFFTSVVCKYSQSDLRGTQELSRFFAFQRLSVQVVRIL